MKIVDCFIFYNEIEILEYRINLLENIVDYFVLVECKKTFTYNDKDLYFDKIKHQHPFNNKKIIHLVIDDYPNNTRDTWSNEYYQRNYIDIGIKNMSLDNQDIIIISDADEIPNPEILLDIRNNKLEINKMFCLHQDFYYYNLNCKRDSKWKLSKILNYEYYTNVLNNKPQKCRESNNCDPIPNGGWHLSYFGDINFIKNKLQNFSHTEYNTQEFRDNDHIKKCILDCKDLFNRNDGMQYIEFVDNTNLPPNYEFFIKNV
jgi:beta-1,4-mannosyl-glycoprotein beta-1,4-N-acetylglucosaminyltransferase